MSRIYWEGRPDPEAPLGPPVSLYRMFGWALLGAAVYGLMQAFSGGGTGLWPVYLVGGLAGFVALGLVLPGQARAQLGRTVYRVTSGGLEVVIGERSLTYRLAPTHNIAALTTGPGRARVEIGSRKQWFTGEGDRPRYRRGPLRIEGLTPDAARAAVEALQDVALGRAR